MKKLLTSLAILFIAVALPAQSNKTSALQDLEKNNKDQDQKVTTATLKSSSRLFGAKDDLTTVIMIIPSKSTVEILGSDSTYYKVAYEENEGFIFKRDAVIDDKPKDLKSSRQQMVSQYNQQVEQINQDNPQQNNQVIHQPNTQSGRFAELQNKYGTSMAKLLSAGKIWKGMTSEMVRDSWGEPAKINKTFEGTMVQEEWVYRNTWLYIENGVLSDWGPLKKQNQDQ